MLIACEILPVDAAHGHTNKQWFYITEDNFKCIMWGEPLPWEKNFNTQKSVSEVPRSTFVEFYFFQAQCLALTHPHSYFLVSNDQCLLCSDQASQLSPALPISCFPTSRHRCESLLRDSQTHRWTHSNSAALDWSWRGKSRSWIKIWDARLRWSPSLLQFPGCNCDIRRLLLTVLDGTRRKDHSGHSNVLLVNTQ